jgi:hypothetical protein
MRQDFSFARLAIHVQSLWQARSPAKSLRAAIHYFKNERAPVNKDQIGRPILWRRAAT